MATVTTGTISAKNPSGRATVSIDPRDYWNEAFSRPKSGYFKVNVTAVTWDATGGSTEKVKLELGLPNHQDAHATQYEYDKTVSDETVGTINQDFNVAWNYGTAGSSARVNGDESVSLLDLNVELKEWEDTAVTSLVATVTYTLTFTEYDPYSVLSESFTMTAVAMPLAVQPTSRQYAGHVLAPNTGSEVLLLQFRSLDVDYAPGMSSGPENAAAFFVKIPPGYTMIKHGVSQEVSAEKVYRDTCTLVVAINDGKYDESSKLISADATPQVLVAAAVLVLPPWSPDSASATLNYDIAEDPASI
jgi:hypothetical protein